MLENKGDSSWLSQTSSCSAVFSSLRSTASLSNSKIFVSLVLSCSTRICISEDASWKLSCGMIGVALVEDCWRDIKQWQQHYDQRSHQLDEYRTTHRRRGRLSRHVLFLFRTIVWIPTCAPVLYFMYDGALWPFESVLRCNESTVIPFSLNLRVLQLDPQDVKFRP